MKRRLLFAAVALATLIAYTLVTSAMWSSRTWTLHGPLSIRDPQPPLPATSNLKAPNLVVQRVCEFDKLDETHIVREAELDGFGYYGCYVMEDDAKEVFTLYVYDEDEDPVWDGATLKRLGVWRWVGLVKTRGDIQTGLLGVLGMFGFWALFYRVPRPRTPPGLKGFRSAAALPLIAAIPVVGQLVLIWTKGVTRERKVKIFYQAAAGWFAFFYLVSLVDVGYDALSIWVVGSLVFAFAVGILGGRFLFAPPGWGYIDGEQPVVLAAPPRRRRAVRSKAVPTPTPPDQSPKDTVFSLEKPNVLPTFADVGGMEELKAELRETVGLSLAFPEEASQYHLTWNGVLLHGRPGVGKTFIARAVAGEFGLNFIAVSAGDLVSAFRGESSRNVEDAFNFAARNVPSLLFFDEFDSIAQNREDWPDQEARRTVNQLLQALVEFRAVRDQIVMAATNDVEGIDPAVIRPGRFDRLIRVDLPDGDGRAAVFQACLRGRPTGADVKVDDLAERSAGLTPAAIRQVVERAAMSALHRTASSGSLEPIRHSDLLVGLDRGGEDRPSIEGWTWDSLILDDDTKEELQQLQYLIEDPTLARSLGVEAPSGALLAGPPGTGKTTIARVLAAEADCSFYPVTAADITSKWLGESEQSIKRLFDRARENRPSIIFIDEIDAIASRRGEFNSYDRQINELLAQIDGLGGHQGVFVLAATNRADQLDPALIRGGRLSRAINVGLPSKAERLQMLRLFTKTMPLAAVDLAGLAASTEGASGADLRALCQQAALHALVRLHGRSARRGHTVLQEDFDEALADRNETRDVTAR